MDNRTIAAGIREKLTPKENWWDGRGHRLPGQLCLGMALRDVLLEHGEVTAYAGEYTETERMVKVITDSLFPERGTRSIPTFNDHEDTTYEDVMLVVKHLEET